MRSARRWGSVVAGRARSTTEISDESSFARVVREAFASEQTAMAVRRSKEVLFDHSRSAWDSSAIDGTRNSTLPASPTSSSASRSDVNVFPPVPQAMISRPPRSSVVNPPSMTLLIAVRWYGRRSELPPTATAPTASPGRTPPNRSGTSRSPPAPPADAPAPTARGSTPPPWPPQCVVVETTSRSVNPPRPDAARNLSRSPLETRCEGA